MDMRCTYGLSVTSHSPLNRGGERRATVANFAQHSYFNLDGASDIRDHRLRILADAYTPVGDNLIPTGEIAAVDRRPMISACRAGSGRMVQRLMIIISS